MTSELIVIGGATGTGKTGLSLAVAELLRAQGRDAEIVNADAMQFYRGMDIGTAKLPPEQRRGIPHHLFDVLDVTEPATVAWYQPLARETITAIIDRGAVPILVGGSGLYIASVVFDLQFPGRDPEVRAELERELEEWGAGMLYKRLREFDPEAAARIDPKNGRRVVRALEVIRVTGEKFSAQLPEQDAWWRPTTMVLAEMPREELVPILDARVVTMWRDGLVGETAELLEEGLVESSTAGKAIGYAQAACQLRGELSEADAIAQAQLLTRKYSRRQVSWFRRYDTAVRVRGDDPWAANLVIEHFER
ncbi:tRNA (adenosine(37)-N6)-dimethylallyltransferase MiaA [Gulosibacter molinativorax]|uniref:tRNA dimethylallyltransferase n=1 Tax=Gulosibacter molinativorax TaxID=256821 RepID=A0ABT7C8R8_9MICO|nr:tRNA (adenosine(37)-N6)-dimethylallyltransferase MiaA [Gulosibacter molinativorax]MDJ1371598.1 tRNA (adenosine(37)-N6)-dimethylallyltransferase MiaA [Gulosibacter molinativorax]QUY61059.1 tRNA dimethylallyltransferase [Gulosibacter molinativorax]